MNVLCIKYVWGGLLGVAGGGRVWPGGCVARRVCGRVGGGRAERLVADWQVQHDTAGAVRTAGSCSVCIVWTVLVTMLGRAGRADLGGCNCLESTGWRAERDRCSGPTVHPYSGAVCVPQSLRRARLVGINPPPSPEQDRSQAGAQACPPCMGSPQG